MIRGTLEYRTAIQALCNDGEDAADALRSTLTAAENKMLDRTMSSRRAAYNKAKVPAAEKKLKIKHGSHGIKKVNPSMYRLADKKPEVKLPKHVDAGTVD
jgi:hypothetical protein